MSSKIKRIEWIYLCKGIGILLVVLGHMIIGYEGSGVYLGYTKVFSYLKFTIYSFHMPLFFACSGYLFKKNIKIINLKQYYKFIKKKFIRIMIPYFVFQYIQIIIKIIMSSSVNSAVGISSIFTIIIKPTGQFWFLYALFIIFIFRGFLNLKIKNENIKLIIIVILHLLIGLNAKCLGILGKAFLYIIYFYIGEILVKYDIINKFNKRKLIYYFIIYLIINIISYSYELNTILTLIFNFILATTMILIIISMSIKLQKRVNKFIEIIKFIGKYSMSIYLLHILFTSGIRIILIKLHIYNLFIQVSLGLILGICMPIILNIVYDKVKIRKLVN